MQLRFCGFWAALMLSAALFSHLAYARTHGQQCGAVSSHVDLAPTLLGWTGVDAGNQASITRDLHGKDPTVLLECPCLLLLPIIRRGETPLSRQHRGCVQPKSARGYGTGRGMDPADRGQCAYCIVEVILASSLLKRICSQGNKDTNVKTGSRKAWNKAKLIGPKPPLQHSASAACTAPERRHAVCRAVLGHNQPC